MLNVDRYTAADRTAVEELFRRMRGAEAADAVLRRWEWQYEQNPALDGRDPLIWLLRCDGDVIGQYATMPVRLSISGREIDAAWGMDVMILPEHQGKGLGRLLFETWDRHVGASIGLGLTDASHSLFKKLQWPDMGRVPRLVKRLSPRALNAPERPLDRALRTARSAVATWRPLSADVREIQRFDDRVTRLWERVGGRFAFAVRRDATYLNWKLCDAPHVTYTIAAVHRGDEMRGYAAIRHAEQQGMRVMILADFLADPDDPDALRLLLRWVERHAFAAKADVIRVFVTHEAFTNTMIAAGYVTGPATLRLVAKINALDLPSAYYGSSSDWHVTIGDSDVDR